MINTEKTIWKTYPEFPFVEVNQFGEVRTKDHYVRGKNGSKRLIKGRVLKQQLSNRGYIYVVFSMNNKIINLYVHRIVVTCFIPNPDNLPEVNHKDNNPTNNAVSNLEWCTRQYNNDYKKNFGTSPVEVSGRPVIAINLDSFKVLWFESQSEAARQLGVYITNVTKVTKGKLHKTGGCWFCYADENGVEKTRVKFGDEMAKKIEKLINEYRN
ncbi:HNH endonuclease [Lactobacillus phage Ldl1]|uniref:HNH endonuclease n=1 Tax=Lactobacillus phage Ldl1 TaxID=1552735 RepID=A0A0A7DMY9_9CAUD|nr:HNH endonuclease [Lactobacillus phage Ldl1]AIS73874.1 HNH endonuclease [Lactobacillus phage Ldl1]